MLSDFFMGQLRNELRFHPEIALFRNPPPASEQVSVSLSRGSRDARTPIVRLRATPYFLPLKVRDLRLDLAKNYSFLNWKRTRAQIYGRAQSQKIGE